MGSWTLVFQLSLHAQSTYKDDIEKIRLEKDHELKDRKNSPLQKPDRKKFQPLNYYPVEESWRVQARFTRLEGMDEIEIPTSSGKSKTFKVYGMFEFVMEGRTFALRAYKRVWPEGQVPADYHESLFVPFKDLTTGGETYGGGRYMDIELPGEYDRMVELDFNLCYNPYCAYGSGFSCPIPPEANFMDIKVTAGEKAYGASH